MEIQEVGLDNKLKSDKIEIVEKLQNNNLVIEICGEGKQVFITYFSTSLKVAINENYGELKVTDQDNKPLPKVYVKAFVKENGGSVNFFKDGYTDIRGKFAYAQVNSKKLNNVAKFAILIMSDDHGSTTREAKVPPNVAKGDNDDAFLQPSTMSNLAKQKQRAMKRAKNH